LKAVVADGRSFNIEIFNKAWGIIGREGIHDSETVHQFGEMIKALQQQSATEATTEEELGDVPDEFLGNALLFATALC